MNTEEVLETLSTEGWDYCIMYYMSADDIENEKVKAAFKAAATALEELKQSLVDDLGQDVFDEIEEAL